MSFCLYCYTFFFLLFFLFSSVLLKRLLQICSRLSGFYLAPQSFNTLALPFLAGLFFYFFPLSPLLLPMSVVLSRVLLRQIRHSIHLVSSVLQRSGNVRSLFPPLSPLTATSPLYHWRADQIGTGPSHSVLDEWKVAMSEDL